MRDATCADGPLVTTGAARSALPAEAGVYVHFPFCKKRCHYCDFNTYAAPDPPIAAYTEAVLEEIAARADELEGRRLVSVFFGGGTPGLWGAEPVRRVLRAIEERIGALGAAEVTIEVNPGECSLDLLRAYREVSGVNRVSFGVQSLTSRLLRSMDRIHTPGEAVDALQDARRAGYATFSADLMFGLPGQSKATWRADLEALLELQPPHLSVYNLMVEPGTPLHLKVRDGKVRLPSEPTQLRMMEDGWQILAERGYAHYEISNFAKPGHESVHNTLYWSGRPYLGVGAGAHSFVPAGPGGAALALRKAGVRKFGEYIARALDRGLGAERFFAMQEEVSAELHLRERMMTGLRLKDGLDVEDVQAVTGIDPRQAFGAVAGRLAQQGLLQIEGARWRLLEGTWPVSDAIFAQFFGD